MWRANLLDPLSLLLSARAPLPYKVSCFVSLCVSLDNSFLNWTGAHARALQGVPLPATILPRHTPCLEMKPPISEIIWHCSL